MSSTSMQLTKVRLKYLSNYTPLFNMDVITFKVINAQILMLV